jgi:hypothetical protein
MPRSVSMVDTVATPELASISQQAILRAALATDFRSFVQYVFGVLRPGIEFRPNWHIDAMRRLRPAKSNG